MFRKIIDFALRRKMLRGMVSYAILYPCGCLVEQTLIEKRTFGTYDWLKCLKFGLYGSFVMAPTIYAWMRLANAMLPRTDLKSSVCKALLEQVAFDPISIGTFLFAMSVMEGKTTFQASREVGDKFLDVYKVGLVFWPVVQTFNFAVVPPRNQAVVVSFFSIIWTAFLAYMKSRQLPNVDLDHHVVDIHFVEM